MVLLGILIVFVVMVILGIGRGPNQNPDGNAVDDIEFEEEFDEDGET